MLHTNQRRTGWRRIDRRRGVALVSVLWVVTLLSLMAANFSRTTRTDITLARNQIENAQVEALADAGVYRAIMGLATLAPEMAWRVDGAIYTWSFGGGDIRISVWDEGGKIDLNTADNGILQNLFVAAGVDARAASALVDAIADYRDGNDLRRLNGAEDDDYRRAGLAHGAKDAPFEVLDELRQVLGMTPELFERVRSALTVHAHLRRPFEPTAPPLVRAALAGQTIEPEASDEEREEAIALEAASDSEALSDDGGSSLPETDQVGAQTVAQGAITPRSRARTFSIHSEARLPDGAVFAREAVVRIDSGGELPFEILAWGRGQRHLFMDESDPPLDD